MIRLIMFTLALALALVIGAAAWLATRPAVPRPFVDDYHGALETLPGSERAIDAGLERFAAVYADLTDERIGERVRALYADPIYFNDSLKTFHDRGALVDYMAANGRMLTESTVDIDRILRDGDDVFVRWTMRFRVRSAGDGVESESVGMTHLRFNADGRIVLHQDFWDSAAGLYRNLPMVGYVLDRVDKRIAR